MCRQRRARRPSGRAPPGAWKLHILAVPAIHEGAMGFDYPHLPAQFEIPDDWWEESGMPSFQKSGAAYLSQEAHQVALGDIEPPFRLRTHPLDFHGFDRSRMVAILRGFVAGDRIPMVPVIELEEQDFTGRPFKFRAVGGTHRFFASIAAGLTHLPVEKRRCTR